MEGATVLYVEDAESTRYVVSRMLGNGGLKVRAADNGAAALAALGAELPDLLLLDVKLPDVSGFELCRRVRALPACERLPIVYLSALFVEREHKVHALESGADAFLTHPVDPEELVATIRALLRARRAERDRDRALGREREARERAEAARAALAEALELQKRVEADAVKRAQFAQQLMGIVSHDLRNPLHAITIASELLMRKAGSDEDRRAPLRRILTASDRAARLVADLLDFTRARLGSGVLVAPAPVDLAAIARRVVSDVEAASGGEQVELAVSGDVSGTWDPDRIAQVLANLVDNAIRHRAGSSRVTIRIAGQGAQVRCDVHNSGDPIPEERLDSLFEPFAMMSPRPGGRSVGLGLFIVRELVVAHGGEVFVRSEPGGTTFTVVLPRAPACSADARARAAPPPAPAS